MGWFYEDNVKHEGYIVGVVEEGPQLFRELSYSRSDKEQQVNWIQIGCECGWRTQRFHAPLGTSYFPHTIFLRDKQVEDEARAIWQNHVKECEPPPGSKLSHLSTRGAFG